MKKHKPLFALAVITLMSFGVQFGVITMASADDPQQLHPSTNLSFSAGGYQTQICADGSNTSPITQFVLSIDTTNWTLDELFISPAQLGTSASTPGTINLNTLTWVGVMNANECVNLVGIGHTTGELGETASLTLTLVSSEVNGLDSGDNTNDNVNTITPFTIVNPPDLEVSTRLKTTGALTPTTLVTYEATIDNIGIGAYQNADFFIMAFVIPNDASVDMNSAVTDGDPDDALNVVNPCFSPGTIDSLGFEGLDAYTGTVVVCQLTTTGDLPPGGSYPIDINITAGPTFAAGNAEVIAIVEGNDPDTLLLFKALAMSTDPLASNSNNIVRLTYDPNALQLTAARCPGQGETTSDGTGCFRVSFNKDIYEPSFTTASLKLSGTGTVSTLTKLGDNSWEVIVTGITGETTLQLVDSNDDPENSVKDLSAVTGSVFVLGESTIRFATATTTAPVAQAQSTTSANGTLAATGNDASVYTFAMLLLIIGLMTGIVINSRRKEKA